MIVIAPAENAVDHSRNEEKPAPAEPSQPAFTFPHAVVGWRWQETKHGIALTVQLAQSAEDFRRQHFRKAVLVMNDRQLRSLARDLTRAASQRGLPLFARKRWSRRIANRLAAVFRRL